MASSSVLLALALLAGSGLSARPPGAAENAARVRAFRAFGPMNPQLSPRGDEIAFSYQGAIWRMPRKGGVMRRLTSGPGFDVQPAWSRDGRRLAYIDGSTGALRVINARDGQLVTALPEAGVSGRLFFHPDGQRLLAAGGNSSRLFAPVIIDVTRAVVQPLELPHKLASAYALSPDGTQVLYGTFQDVSGEQQGTFGPQTDLWIAPWGGGTSAKLGRSAAHVFQLWWAPGSVYFSTDLGGAHNDLWTLDPRAPGHAHRLTSGQADEDAPSVSADGRWLVYTDNRENATALIVRDLATGEESRAVPSRLDFGVPSGSLRLSVVDKDRGQPVVARVSIQQEGGKFFAPVGALYQMLDGVLHFYADRHADLALPRGRYLVRAWRGLEYREARATIAITARKESPLTVTLERWTDPAARSLWNGESHIHANYGYGEWYHTPQTVRRQIEGEGINAANLVVSNSDGDGVFDREFFRGEPDPLSTDTHVIYWNQEYRSTLWGHFTFLDLKRLVEPIFTGFAHTTNPWDVPTNADSADHVHLQGGYVNYTHPAAKPADLYLGPYTAKALPVDVALGKVDSMDINSNGNYEGGVALWYRLLNCGFRLSASAGTDVFLNRVRPRTLPARDRAYVPLEGGFSYSAWAKGLRDGRAFVTNGPMVELSVGDRALGQVVKLARPAEVPVRAAASWQLALARAELVYNGEVIAPATVSADGLRATLDRRVRLDRSGWLSFRAYGPQNIQAHTSAIYVEVGGRPAGLRQDAEYFLAWIDRLEAKLRERDRLPSSAAKAHVKAQLDAARAVYRGIADRRRSR